jgi:hypothetical protein
MLFWGVYGSKPTLQSFFEAVHLEQWIIIVVSSWGDFEVYTGKDFYPNPDGDEEDKQLGHSYNVVLGLLRNNNLLGKGYTVYTDNY